MIKDPEDFGITVKVETIDGETAKNYLENNAKMRNRMNSFIIKWIKL